MTACSTLLSPLLTPLAMKLLAGTYVAIDAWAMMQSILTMVIAPLLAGLAIQHFLPAAAARLARVLPVVAMAGICAIIGITIASSRDQLLTVGLALFGAAVCHNAVGYALGYSLARRAGLDRTDARTVAIEVGMQNGGMATGLAFEVLKSPAAALGAAIFGPWSAITASVLASWWRRRTRFEPPTGLGTSRGQYPTRIDLWVTADGEQRGPGMMIATEPPPSTTSLDNPQQ
jgi:BASS family bile acid:Na+ symporter